MSENEAAALVFSFSSSFSSSSSIFGGFRGRERGRGGGLKLIFRQALKKNFPRHCLLSKTVILQAKKEKRPALRPAPNCPWWPYVWSGRPALKVGPGGRVPIGTQRLRLE